MNRLISWIKSLLGLGDKVKTSKDVKAVCFGMGQSRSAGPCPGAVLDATAMSSLLSKYAKSGVVTFLDSKATYKIAKSAMEEAVQHDLAIIFYSGHGGRDESDRKTAWETDNRDEYLCFYDKTMRDDEIWNIVNQAKGRVFLIFDCCHSGTMYRSLEAGDKKIEIGSSSMTFGRFRRHIDLELETARNMAADHAEVGMSHEEIERIYSKHVDAVRMATPNMLCWSAAREHEYSYGTNSGGIFTNALRSCFKSSCTYGSLWSSIARRMRREPNTPVRTQFGKGFGGLVFR